MPKESKTGRKQGTAARLLPKLIREFKRGDRIPAIAARHNLSPACVRYTLKAAGLILRPRGWHLHYPFRVWSERNKLHTGELKELLPEYSTAQRRYKRPGPITVPHPSYANRKAR